MIIKDEAHLILNDIPEKIILRWIKIDWIKYVCFENENDIIELFNRVKILEKQVSDLHLLLTR